uniref:F-actin-capping protein subunit alpha n=1 Tax=Ganoderma boninense TaxID=34458 RepID=A0A5K1K743_9APHY|nr:F-actin-capping protein subunit alpha [Ganoderma boninense]
MEVAGYKVEQLRSKYEYSKALEAARIYAKDKMNYFHMWTLYVPRDCETATGPTSIDCPTYRDGPEDIESLEVCVLCCSAPSAYCRRISEAQYQWLKHVMGKEPRWYPIGTWEYEDVEDELWGEKECCPKRGGLIHLVDLETGTWKNRKVEGK